MQKADISHILGLFIAEKHLINNEKIHSSLIENLKNSKSERLKEVVKERYESETEVHIPSFCSIS